MSNGSRVDLDGAETFRRTADAAADALADLSRPLGDAGALLLDQAQPPVDTGALEESLYFAVDGDTAYVTSDLDYFPYNAEFLVDDLAANQDDVVDIFRDYLDRATATIHGT